MTKKKKPEDLLKVGRPTTFNQEIANRICHLVSTHTIGYRKLHEKYNDLPYEQTVREWRVIFPQFGLQYAQAKIAQCELLAEECMDIADDMRNDWMETCSEEEQRGFKLNGEHVNRSRLRIDTRKFFAMKLLPKKYGEFIGQSTSNPELDEDCKKRYKEMDERNKKDF
jgi:hypothetical protein